MASNADRVLHNFRWRIESTAPTHQRPRRPFRYMDPADINPEDHPVVRLFSVSWQAERDEEDSVTDSVERRAVHTYVVEVVYATDYDQLTLMEIVLQDRHDLIKTLRDPRLFVGTSASDASADIGLQSRRVVGVEAEIDADERVASLRLECECEIWETE